MASAIDMDETTQSPPDSYVASMGIDENTPPPPDLQNWQEELYGDYPDGILQASIPRYDFRPEARVANRFVTITWIDQDESGTYDPVGRDAQEAQDQYLAAWAFQRVPSNCDF